MKFQTLSTLILTILFAFTIQSSRAQYPGMGAFRAQQNKQFVNGQMNMMMQMNMMVLNNNANLINSKYSYIVTFKDSSQRVVLSKIFFDTTTKKTYLLLVDKSFSKKDMANREQKIYTDQTINISRIAGSAYMKNQVFITGIPNDSCWMFKIVKGAINIYSYLSECEGGGGGFDPATIVAIQLNEGSIVKLNQENLNQMVNGDADALEDVVKKKFYKAIKKYNRDKENEIKK